MSTPETTAAAEAPSPERDKILAEARCLALDLHNLLDVADIILPDIFPLHMSPEYTQAFERTGALLAAAVLMARKLKECLDNAD